MSALAKIHFRRPSDPVLPPPLPQTTPEDRARARFSLAGKRAIVTGGAGGLGLTISTALLEHGLSGLIIFDRDLSTGTVAVSSLQSSFPNATILFKGVNVADEMMVEEAVEAAGTVDVLLCCAGIVGVVDALEMPIEQWNRILEVNLTGSFICARTVAKRMIATSTHGSIILTASISAHTTNFPQPQAAYNVSKAGVLHLVHGLAAEWARHGIRVNSISPGYMDTVLNEGEHLEEPRRIWNERTPMGRMGKPEEVCGAAVLLASDAGSFITGSDIKVDGGYTVL
ncbi:NAD P-binding protein [Gloeophyllum trabeum ATCC 11539]|uniref:D-arabinitol 2-dehydrogenase [ribulose-forming] n=1 Tax=Gloeophyllum trabeum (strain ATCC 11539 / FP-39264 / Madison 617) TaxID=670483 RepID=S7PZ84_GLOTA|nr:NAD P-binding protein [Gloeophyllum trabeum ATCC 11539]EPQ52961.1 NAD P-binding protein [Gloeophyllum trabeum ATCC 11539]